MMYAIIMSICVPNRQFSWQSYLGGACRSGKVPPRHTIVVPPFNKAVLRLDLVYKVAACRSEEDWSFIYERLFDVLCYPANIMRCHIDVGCCTSCPLSISLVCPTWSSVTIWADLEEIFSLPFGVGERMEEAGRSLPRARQGDDLEYFLPPIAHPKVLNMAQP